MSTEGIRYLRRRPQLFWMVGFFVAFGIIGSVLLHASHASTPTASFETENGTASSCGSRVADTSASNSAAIKFSSCTSSGNPSATAGASLPISYSLASLTGTIYYVSPSGSDTANGSVTAPFATLSHALSTAPSGATIVLRGGTYRGQGGLSINKAVKLIAYPGEIPVFNGATSVSGGWTASGSLSYRSYTPMATGDGDGITFSSCMNQTSSCLGKYPDQVWVGTSQLQQVGTQAAVTAGKFFVDTTNSRLYLASSDVSLGNVEVSSVRKFASVNVANVTFEGFKLIRYSDNGADYGVITLNGGADNSLLQDMFMSDMSFLALHYSPTSTTDHNTGSIIKDSTIQYGNWQGIIATATDNLTLDHDDIGHMNQFNEFTSSPSSGSLKTSRTWYTKVLNSKIMGNNSHGVWFDQSNYDVEVAGNDFENNSGAALFFEISDYLYAANNYFKSNGRNSIEVSGSSHAYIVNNTMVGSANQIGVYVDERGVSGCSDPSQPLCTGALNSDRDTYHTHLATMTWIPSIDLDINNIQAYPSGGGYCATASGLCITHTNGPTTIDISQILHHADTANNVPQTTIDSNAYANGTGNLIDTVQLGNFTALNTFASTMAGAPVSISGFETLGHAGNSYVNTDGSPTSALAALHSSAHPVPSISTINTYVPAGSKHYGVLWK